MKLELDAIHDYRSCAEKAHTPEAREIYKELADWEQTHYSDRILLSSNCE